MVYLPKVLLLVSVFAPLTAPQELQNKSPSGKSVGVLAVNITKPSKSLFTKTLNNKNNKKPPSISFIDLSTFTLVYPAVTIVAVSHYVIKNYIFPHPRETTLLFAGVIAGLFPAAVEAQQSKPININDKNPNPNSIKLLSSKAEKPELPSPSRYL